MAAAVSNNFIHIGRKTQKLIIFAIGQFWLVGLVGRKMVVGISNSFYVVFGQKKQKLKIFAKYWPVLVGRAGRSKNGRSYFKHSEYVQRLTNDLCTKFKTNRMKIG